MSNYIWKGAWVTSTLYDIDDLVEEDGSAYICITQHTSGTFSTDLSNWNLVAEKGSTPTNTTMARAYLNGAQNNLTNLTLTKVNLDTENWDVGGNFDVANSRYVAPVTGYYMLAGCVGYTGVVTDKRYWCQIKVGGTVVTQGIIGASSTSAIVVNCSSVEYVVAGQYIELIAQSGAGVNTVDLIPGSITTYLSVILVSA